MRDARELSDFIGRIYECIRQPAGWTAVLEHLCKTIDAEGASIHIVNPVTNRNQVFVEFGVDPQWSELGRTIYAAMSPIGAAVLLADIDQPLSAFDFIDEQEFRESRYYREWLAPKGYFDMMGALLAKTRQEVAALGAVRLQSKGRFTAENRAFIGLIAPHVRRAVSIAGMFEDRRASDDALSSFMNQLSTAVLFIDGGARILRANNAADEMLARGDVVRLRDGRVRFVDAAAEQAIRSRLASQQTDPLLVSVVGADGAKFGVSLLGPDKGADSFAILIKDQQPETPAIGRFLASRYGLSPREIAVLMPLVQGAAPQDVADQLGVGIATVRTHLSNLFIKTRTTRQAELVAEIYQAISSLSV